MEGIKKNIQQSNFKVSGLALYCYCGDTIKYGLFSKKKKKKTNVPKKVTTGGWENFSVLINFYEK